MTDIQIHGLGSDPTMQAILLVGPAAKTRDLAQALRSIAHSLCCDAIQQVQRIVEAQDIELIICIGLTHAQLEVCLEGLTETRKVIVISEDARTRAQMHERVYFVAGQEISSADLARLVVAALARGLGHEVMIGTTVDPELIESVLDAVTPLADCRDLATASASIAAGLLGLLRADRIHCLYHDAEASLLWACTPAEREHPATSGVAGFVARTRLPEIVDLAQLDSRYHASIDDPEGDGRERLLLSPVLAHGHVHVVVVVVRGAHRPSFGPRELGILELFCERAGPLIEQLALREHAKALVRAREDAERGPFRIEAVRARKRVVRYGDVIRITPGWVGGTYWVLVALALVGSLYLVFAHVNLYSTGPAVVRLHQRTEVTAQASGAMAELVVAPGQRVERDQLLARLDDEQARGELARVEAAWNTQLRARLLDPSDAATAAAVVGLRQQLHEARAELTEREIRAPESGVVGDLRIRPGQHIAVGQVVLSLSSDELSQRVIALMPGADSPRIEPGMIMRVELPGYRHAYRDLVVEHVDDEVIGPSEAQRFLGPALADSIALAGPVVLIEARLPSAEFSVDGISYRYHEGMQATAEIRVRSESLLELLIPGLQGVLPGD
jgi:multidrug resistance efflux pump/GAF domain-containing protein